MYEGRMSKKLGELIDQYQERFKGNLDDGFSLFDTMLSHDALVARLEQAIAEGKIYDPRAEEWDPDMKKAIELGEIIS